tara:strand:+ start:301 stop:885 length:585 start_codon:yes stop_codon:yes gene_type:complete
MANNDAPFGLRATRMIGGAPYNGGQSRYRIANNESTSMFQGDLVIQLTAGTIDRFDPSTADALVLGVFMGCRFTDPSTKKETFQNHYTQTAADDIEAFVIDDPNVVFEIQADDTFPVTDLFGNFNIVNTVAGSTTTGISGSELDVTTGAATVALPIKAIDISLDPDNDDTSSANTNVLVVINNHVYGHVTAGLT